MILLHFANDQVPVHVVQRQQADLLLASATLAQLKGRERFQVSNIHSLEGGQRIMAVLKIQPVVVVLPQLIIC